MGFLGLGGYSKPGKGVKRDAPQKKRFFQFFELFFRKFGKLVQLNLLYLLFCLPIITIGPATAAMTKIARYYVEEKPVFLFSDFWNAFKENFVQGLITGIIDAALIYLLIQAFFFYFTRTAEHWAYYIPLGFIFVMAFLLVLTNFYVYLLMVTVQLKLFALYKNAVLLAFVGIKTNLLTFLFTGAILVPCAVFLPLTGIFLLLFVFSTLSLIATFNSFPYIYRHVIRPYYLQNGLDDPYEVKEEEEDNVFIDAT